MLPTQPLDWSFTRSALNLLCRTLAALLAGATTPPAWSARPMITDDARVTDALGCQVETWLRREPGPPRVTEFWALPACNPTGNIEMTLGGATRQEAGEPRQSTIQAQLKTILIPLETDGFGLGIAAGVLRRDGRGAPASPIDSAYLYAPMSKALAGDRVVLHLNIGASHDRNERKTFRTWGLGSETAITSRIYLIAETFGDGTGAPFRHAGFRFWLLPNRLQLDTTHGQRAGSANSRWISVGMRVLLPPK